MYQVHDVEQSTMQKTQAAEGFDIEHRIDGLPIILLQGGISRFDTLLLLLYKQEPMHLNAIERTIQFSYIIDGLVNEKFKTSEKQPTLIRTLIKTLTTRKPTVGEFMEKVKALGQADRVDLVAHINQQFPYIDIPGNKRVYADLKVLNAMKLIRLTESRTGKRTISKLAAIDSDFYRIWEARRRELLLSSKHDRHDKLLSDFYMIPLSKGTQHYSIYLRYAEYL